jgi:hypothetical protein
MADGMKPEHESKGANDLIRSRATRQQPSALFLNTWR